MIQELLSSDDVSGRIITIL